jgi:hypothetical protein
VSPGGLRCTLLGHRWQVVLAWIERRQDQAFRHRCTRCGAIREELTQ